MPKQAILTVRLSADAFQGLRQRARLAGVTPSELVRSLIQLDEAAMDRDQAPTLFERTKRWVGAVNSKAVGPASRAREELENWVPDRRG